MLQIRDLEEIKNDPKKVEEFLYDEERNDLNVYENMMKRASAMGYQFILVNSVPEILKNLLRLSGYEVYRDGDVYRIDWSCQEMKNSEVESKQTIKLQDGSFVEIDGANVKHINENDQILYDSASRIAYNQENIDNVRSIMSDSKEKSAEERAEDFRLLFQ